MSCGFCESIKSQMMLDRGQDERLISGYLAKYTKVTYRDLDRSGVWEFAGQTTSGEYPLNFCPECGRRIVRNER